MLFDYFPHNLKYLLDSGKITVKKILEITNIKSGALVTMWKNGQRQIMPKDMIAIANYLNITIDDLMNKDLMKTDNVNNELDVLFNRNKDKLTDSDKAIIKTIIEQRVKEIDKEN